MEVSFQTDEIYINRDEEIIIITSREIEKEMNRLGE